MITRRTVAKGIAATPLVGAAAGAVAPSSAHATTIDAGQFRLAGRSSNSSGQFSDLAAGLATKLPTRSVADVLAGANRPATHLTSAPSGVGAFQDGFVWEGGDRAVTYWIPQGITTSADALGAGVWPAGGDRVILVSWYFETDPDGDGVDEYTLDKGLRLSFVDYNSSSAPMYRHVLLVEPVLDSGGQYSFNPIRKHAGGILWYGNLLYVVDTFKGLRVFDLNTIFEVATAETEVCGLHTDGQFYGYGYQYVLPQSLAYDNAGKYVRYSAIGLDRASTPDSLVVSEFSGDPLSDTTPTVDYSSTSFIGEGKPGVTAPKLVRWPLDYTTRQISSLTPTEAVSVQQAKIQGAVSRESKHYLSVSNGPSSHGTLRTVTSTGSTPSTLISLATGCEDLSYHSSGASDWAYSESVIWNLSEYTSAGRYVYAVRADGT